MNDKELSDKLTHEKTINGLWDDMFEASDRLFDALYGPELCPVCGSPLNDSGICCDLGDNNCTYMGPYD